MSVKNLVTVDVATVDTRGQGNTAELYDIEVDLCVSANRSDRRCTGHVLKLFNYA
jgi:hypothetical protein